MKAMMELLKKVVLQIHFCVHKNLEKSLIPLLAGRNVTSSDLMSLTVRLVQVCK